MDVIVLSVGHGAQPRDARDRRDPRHRARTSTASSHTPGEPMDPVSTSVAGIFVAGAAAGPKDLEDTIGMAGAAAVRAVARDPRATPAGVGAAS